jgi:hypothetical protein
VYAAQELAVSLIYLYEMKSVMQFTNQSRSGRITKQLIAMNIWITFLNILLVVAEFCSWYKVEPSLKALIYSIKLKVEFGVLSKLVSILQNKNDRKQIGFDGKTLSTQGRPSVQPQVLNMFNDEEKALGSTHMTPISTLHWFIPKL